MTFLRRGAGGDDEGEARFEAIADAAPVMMWIADASKACTWFNLPWLQFTGRRLQEHIGDGWMHDVHPDDLAACVSTYHHAFDRRQRMRNDYRLRRADGTWRMVEDVGMPRLDVSETDKTFEVKAELPGVKKDDVHVSIDGQRVTIEGECQQANEQRQGEQVVYSERSTRKYQRSFTLPSEVDDASAQARLEDGVLMLSLPKKQGGTARQLTIQ